MSTCAGHDEVPVSPRVALDTLIAQRSAELLEQQQALEMGRMAASELAATVTGSRGTSVAAGVEHLSGVLRNSADPWGTDLMTRLEAGSRFEAGVNAARRGLALAPAEHLLIDSRPGRRGQTAAVEASSPSVTAAATSSTWSTR